MTDKEASGEQRSESESESGAPTATWTAPLVRFDAAWTKLETRLATGVVVLEVVSLCVWVSLRGLATGSSASGGAAGIVFRCIFTALVLGAIAHFATRPKSNEPTADEKKKHDVAVFVGAMVGVVAGRLWANVGVAYWGNWIGWLESASAAAFFGGLRGLATRLTLWLALLGASLATAKGKHIHVDVLVRFVPTRLRAAVAMVGAIAAATVCFTASFGFLEAIAIGEFRSASEKPCADDPKKFCDTTLGEKYANVRERMGRDFFLFGRQASLDMKTLPHVMKGEPFQGYLSATEWNDWLKTTDWAAHISASAADGLVLSVDDPAFRRMPFVNIPNIEPSRDLLIREGGFILPFGLFMIGLRFVLRALLVFGGRVNLDPDAQHGGDEELAHAHEKELQEAAAIVEGESA